ncbi:Mis12-Mtw1 protein family-domain-containing protein [Fusarium oxysporum f. sp. albedinis]|nr:Mis12-Mtw1 protein family-domain-containing protein [Fusarium oxysporum f. sp. albedinis]KAJ0129314.1 putative enoyl-CoA hydratase [Fusarium oxysporum f. sp. albedinis]
MTTLVTTRRPLQVISMSNEHGRRLSKRLAAAAATDYEHDDDFAFVRKSKRIKADKTDEPKPEAVPKPKAETVKKSAKGRPAAKQRAAKAPTTNGTIVEEEPLEKETNATTKPATRKSSRRKASVDAPDEREIKVPKRPSTSRRTRRSGEAQEEEAPQPTPASIPEPGPGPKPETVAEAASASRVNGAPKKRGSRAKPTRPPPDWDKSPQCAPPVQSGTIVLPMSDTPIINRNKEMRKKGGNSNRRSSLGNRGRRASSLIESGQTAIPHREVNPADFYKLIEAEGLTESRRMKQLLTWCGERALAGKPPHGTPNSNAILGARAIQDQLLKDFAGRSEFSDWFSREDDGPNVPVVLRPNPRNMELDEKLAQLEINIKRLQDQKKAWQAIRKPPSEQPPLFSEGETGPIVLPDFDLLDPCEGKIRGSLADKTALFDAARSQTESRLRTIQSSLEFQVDQLADNVHKLEQRVLVAGKEADKVLSVSALRLRQREEREKANAGTRDMPVIEVLRSLGNILPEGGG